MIVALARLLLFSLCLFDDFHQETRVRAFGESDNPVFLAQRERMIEAMRTAGAPDG